MTTPPRRRQRKLSAPPTPEQIALTVARTHLQTALRDLDAAERRLSWTAVQDARRQMEHAAKLLETLK